jgi:hypothetical protein
MKLATKGGARTQPLLKILDHTEMLSNEKHSSLLYWSINDEKRFTTLSQGTAFTTLIFFVTYAWAQSARALDS